MTNYQGPAEAVLPDGTALPVQVSLRAEPGLLDGMRGTATGDVMQFLNVTEVEIRLPGGERRMFLIKDAPFEDGKFRLELISDGVGSKSSGRLDETPQQARSPSLRCGRETRLKSAQIRSIASKVLPGAAKYPHAPRAQPVVPFPVAGL